MSYKECLSFIYSRRSIEDKKAIANFYSDEKKLREHGMEEEDILVRKKIINQFVIPILSSEQRKSIDGKVE